MESTDSHHGIDAKDLSLVLDLVLSYKFKIPEFEKYNGTSCPEAHITMFYRQMTGYVNNDQLLIHYFQDNLVGAVSKWYNQLSRTRIGSWKDLAQAFMKQYCHVTDMNPDRITLQNMEKKPSESFRKRHKNFSDIVMNGEMIENAIRSGKIDAGESNKRSALRKKENEVNNKSAYNKGYSKSITVNQPRKVVADQQISSRKESGTKQNAEKPQFMPISMSYRELYQSLFNPHVVSLFYLKYNPCTPNGMT
ncbi:uncharacterized protein LOC128033896 [Gossypium raimondii]|uniref:uncharacterized protein LOC128033896 n=1 Tax=Gossypium raimondii TaxID=29730 RepID=UPI00227C3F63|nr:uncharacterized protein LOC128033896 [Gossypium raimondii]